MQCAPCDAGTSTNWRATSGGHGHAESEPFVISWRSSQAAPRFRRAAGMLPLPLPQRGGSIEALAAFLYLPKSAGKILVAHDGIPSLGKAIRGHRILAIYP